MRQLILRHWADTAITIFRRRGISVVIVIGNYPDDRRKAVAPAVRDRRADALRIIFRKRHAEFALYPLARFMCEDGFHDDRVVRSYAVALDNTQSVLRQEFSTAFPHRAEIRIRRVEERVRGILLRRG